MVGERNMRYTKLIVISTDPLCPRITTLFGLEGLSKRKIDLEYWDVSHITYPFASKEHVSLPGVVEKEILSIKDFKSEVRKIDSRKTLVVVYMNYAVATAVCYRVLSRYNIPMAYCVNGVMPPRKSIGNNKKLLIPTLKLIFKNQLVKLLKNTSLFKPLSYQFNTCLKAQVDYKVSNETHYIPFNCTDRQMLLNLPANENAIERTVVFLDQNYAAPSDFKILGAVPINPQKYFRQMNELFDKVEKEYNCEVVIAAHPTALHYREHNPFNGRKCFFGMTAALVQNSIGAISHYSTSFSFAVLTRKPLIFVTSNDMNATFFVYEVRTKQFSKMLDCRHINLDHYTDFQFKEVNNQAYESYEANYLKHPDLQNENNVDILYNVLDGKYEK